LTPASAVQAGLVSDKEWLVTMLCFLLGVIGVHRVLYTGHVVIGIIQSSTLGGCGISRAILKALAGDFAATSVF